MYVLVRASKGQHWDRRCHILTSLSVSATSWTLHLYPFLSHSISVPSYTVLCPSHVTFSALSVGKKKQKNPKYFGLVVFPCMCIEIAVLIEIEMYLLGWTWLGCSLCWHPLKQEWLYLKVIHFFFYIISCEGNPLNETYWHRLHDHSHHLGLSRLHTSYICVNNSSFHISHTYIDIQSTYMLSAASNILLQMHLHLYLCACSCVVYCMYMHTITFVSHMKTPTVCVVCVTAASRQASGRK